MYYCVVTNITLIFLNIVNQLGCNLIEKKKKSELYFIGRKIKLADRYSSNHKIYIFFKWFFFSFFPLNWMLFRHALIYMITWQLFIYFTYGRRNISFLIYLLILFLDYSTAIIENIIEEEKSCFYELNNFENTTASLVYEKDLPAQCPKCLRNYSQRRNMLRHLKDECGVEPKQSCPYCPYKAKRRNVMKLHVINCHEVIK